MSAYWEPATSQTQQRTPCPNHGILEALERLGLTPQQVPASDGMADGEVGSA